ncbi:MAG: hypothetical protein AAF402_06450 [Pseudomonadota bacterium]
MSKRRNVLKTVIASSAVVSSWSKPVIDSVVIPAHAQTTDTSGEPSEDTTCSAPAGCYRVDGGVVGSFAWAGGAGPQLVEPVLGSANCIGDSEGEILVAVADSLESAASLLGQPAQFVRELPPVSPAPQGGCAFYQVVQIQ